MSLLTSKKITPLEAAIDIGRYNEYYSPMPAKSIKEKPEKHFVSREETASAGIQAATERLRSGLGDLLRPHDLTLAQFNVLRILREANTRGASCSEVSSRLATKDSDMTRLLERMEKRDLIRRKRHTSDRRVVLAFIAEKGLDLMESLDTPVNELQKRDFSALPKKDIEKLAKLLRKVGNETGSKNDKRIK